jgi:hypothetical protein
LLLSNNSKRCDVEKNGEFTTHLENVNFEKKKKKYIILLKHIHGEEASIRRAEEEEEKGEGKSCRTNESGCGAVEARADEVVDGVGVASQGCVRLACDSEIE